MSPIMSENSPTENIIPPCTSEHDSQPFRKEHDESVNQLFDQVELSAIEADRSNQDESNIENPLNNDSNTSGSDIASGHRVNELNGTDDEVTEIEPVRSQETELQRAEREERESEMLAWQMMQEENAEMYRLQMQFMQDNAEAMSEEDRLALEAAMEEASQQIIIPQVSSLQNTRGDDDGAAHSGGEEEEEEEENSEMWDYERLLQLGQEIGGKCCEIMPCLFQLFYQ